MVVSNGTIYALSIVFSNCKQKLPLIINKIQVLYIFKITCNRGYAHGNILNTECLKLQQLIQTPDE